MARDDNSGPQRFPTTHWSLVAQAVGPEAGARPVGLDRYLPPLRAHLVYRKGIAPDRADDLLQEFIARKVLQNDLIAQADQQQGKFRTFLLTALDRFAINWRRDERAKKRSPAEGRMVEVDEEAVCARREPGPSEVYDTAWARQTILQALKRMREECEEGGRIDLWEVFQCRIVAPILDGAEPVDYRQLVQRFALQSPQQAANLLATAKRMYVRALRAVVHDYTQSERELENEIAELREVLCRANT